MRKRPTLPSIQTHACTLLILLALTLFTSVTGCVTEHQNNQTSADPNPVNITYTHCYSYNGTSFLTGVIKNVGTWNLVDLSLQAKGDANNTTREQGYADPQTGVKSTLTPGESTPFMIKMSQTTSGTNPATSQTQVASVSSKTATPTRNVSSNKSNTQANVLVAKTCDLLYTIMTPEYRLSKTEPTLLSITNNKTIFSSQTISVSGEVYNEGTKNVTSSFVAVAFYRNDGYVLGVFVGSPQGEFGPNKTAPFQIDIPSHFFDSSNSSVNATRIEEYAYELAS
ncbi:MAG: hypothetical protein ACXV5H_07520 [Halobacteriota archaeon]